MDIQSFFAKISMKGKLQSSHPVASHPTSRNARTSQPKSLKTYRVVSCIMESMPDTANHLSNIALTNLRLKIPLHSQILPPIHILNHQTLLVSQMQQTNEPVRSGNIC
jgi:hypothetical protein